VFLLFSFNTPTIAIITMGFPFGVSKTTLPDHIEKSGTLLLFPYKYCAHLNKQYIKLIISKCYSECTYFNCCCYTKILLSNLAWKKLLEAQEKIYFERQKALEEVASLYA
jgi:hypothetical protein